MGKRQVMLCEMANKYGDFQTAKIKLQPDGTIKSTKWRSVLGCGHTEKGLKFLDKATDMTAPRPIVFIDIDKPGHEPVKRAVTALMREFSDFPWRLYSSAGKGHHIHILIPELTLGILNISKREQIRREIITALGGETTKASERTMILIPGAPNRKTGQPKRILAEWGTWT